MGEMASFRVFVSLQSEVNKMEIVAYHYLIHSCAKTVHLSGTVEDECNQEHFCI